MLCVCSLFSGAGHEYKPLTIEQLEKISEAYLKHKDEPSHPLVQADTLDIDPSFSSNKATWKPETIVKVRINASFDFPVNWKNNSTYEEQQEKAKAPKKGFLGNLAKLGNKTLSKSTGKKKVQDVKEVPAIIINFHGGGFVAMSSRGS